MPDNLPVSYDFHGDLPFSMQFNEIPRNEIHVYLDVDTFVGVKTCGQVCNHCWFVNYPKVQKKNFDPQEGVEIYKALSRQGFKVFPRYTDSFAYNGELMRLYGTANARTYYQGDDEEPTETMERGEAWTSGRPLLGENADELLDAAKDAGYGTITITYHGLIDAGLTVLDASTYPIDGVLFGSEFERVVGVIRKYNARFKGKGGFEGFRISVGVTIGTHNNTLEMLKRYVFYFNAMEVSVVRFNKFFDHGNRHPHLVMSQDQARQAYRDLKWIHSSMQLDFQMGVSEDMGTFGIGVMEFPEHVGWCRAGRQLFAVIPTKVKPVAHPGAPAQAEHIGDIVGCVNLFEPVVGSLVRYTTSPDNSARYDLVFFDEEIEKLTRKRLDGTYKNGCFARELMDEIEGVPSS